jgi:hypothetical protein
MGAVIPPLSLSLSLFVPLGASSHYSSTFYTDKKNAELACSTKLGSRVGGGTYGDLPAYVGVGAYVGPYVGAYVGDRRRLPT